MVKSIRSIEGGRPEGFAWLNRSNEDTRRQFANFLRGHARAKGGVIDQSGDHGTAWRAGQKLPSRNPRQAPLDRQSPLARRFGSGIPRPEDLSPQEREEIANVPLLDTFYREAQSNPDLDEGVADELRRRLADIVSGYTYDQ